MIKVNQIRKFHAYDLYFIVTRLYGDNVDSVTIRYLDTGMSTDTLVKRLELNSGLVELQWSKKTR